ncbi:hypothetical protein WBG78_21960 [Chryseolinea sp. T2]|uniref:DUF6436 domain-containing protein n=1 Tax=Chryseolinea sp. T2 TaxID=3129255 RepID=UPI003078A0D4
MTFFASRRSRTAIALALLACCMLCVGCVFWKQELQYRRPTPVPEKYVPVAIGDSIQLPSELKAGTAWFLHFYNPDCPCSRFNVQHLRSLIRTYSDSVAIAVVVESNADIERARKAFGEQVRIVQDENGTIARACGVYSTPQAAIVDGSGSLFYRGNYNVSRYCTSRATNFAELSLIALLNHQQPPQFGILAMQSYGCELEPDKPDLVSLY